MGTRRWYAVLSSPLREQTGIYEFLDEQTVNIDAAIAADRRVIDLLKEVRTRLIADVVTGRVDVREAAAKLPKELSDEQTELGDAEEIAEDRAANEKAENGDEVDAEAED